MEVWIASHIGDAVREQTLLLALESIQNNTRHPDNVWISYSQSPNVRITTERWHEKIPSSTLKILYQPQKTLQFQHFQMISEQDHDSHAIICFLDDDDLVDPQKYEAVWNYFQTHSTSVVDHPICHFGMWQSRLVKNIDEIKSFERITGPQEYFSLSIRFYAMRRWFSNRNNKKTMRHHKYITDLFFGARFRMLAKKHKIPQILQYHRTQNKIVKRYWSNF